MRRQAVAVALLLGLQGCAAEIIAKTGQIVENGTKVTRNTD